MPRTNPMPFLVIPSTGQVAQITLRQAQEILGSNTAKPAQSASPAKGKASTKPAAKPALATGAKQVSAKATKAEGPAKKTASKKKSASKRSASSLKEAASPKAPVSEISTASTKAATPKKASKPAKQARGVTAGNETSTKSSASMQAVRDAARVAILRHGKPMPRRELFNTLTTGKNPLVIAGKDPVENMATMLYKDKGKSFKNLKGQGFWIEDQPLPEGAKAAS